MSYKRGSWERVDLGEDAILTMVVRDREADVGPRLEADIYLLRPRRDTVLVFVEAEYQDGQWRISAIHYLYS